VRRQAAAAAAGSNGSGPTSSSSSFSNDSSKREEGAAPDGKGKGSSHMLDASDSAASIASGSGGSSSSGPGSEPSRRRRQQQQQQQQGAPPEPRTRLGRALAFLAALRSRLALRRLLTMAFMFAVGSLMSLASSRGRVAGPQEVRVGVLACGVLVCCCPLPVACFCLGACRQCAGRMCNVFAILA
jgi:hypothetical protein